MNDLDDHEEEDVSIFDMGGESNRTTTKYHGTSLNI